MNLETLLAERAIELQLVAFARAMDNRDWQAIERITAQDLRADFGTGEVVGRDAVIDYMRSFLDNCGPTQHFVGNFVITVDGDSANSETYVSDIHLGKPPRDTLSFRTLGNYSDTWKNVAGVWLITRRVKNNRAAIGSLEVFHP